jgi:hypothetical protein
VVDVRARVLNRSLTFTSKADVSSCRDWFC